MHSTTPNVLPALDAFVTSFAEAKLTGKVVVVPLLVEVVEDIESVVLLLIVLLLAVDVVVVTKTIPTPSSERSYPAGVAMHLVSVLKKGVVVEITVETEAFQLTAVVATTSHDVVQKQNRL